MHEPSRPRLARLTRRHRTSLDGEKRRPYPNLPYVGDNFENVKGVVISLGLATVAVGVWLLHQTHAVDLACRLNASPLTGAGVAPNCMNDVSFYFLGFVLTTAGAFAALAAAILLRRRRRERVQTSASPAVTLRTNRDDSWRQAA